MGYDEGKADEYPLAEGLRKVDFWRVEKRYLHFFNFTIRKEF
jgi:hypothetical protein